MAVGDILLNAGAAPGTPAAGYGDVYVDSTSKNLCVKDDAGVVKHGVQTITATNFNYLSALSDAGAFSQVDMQTLAPTWTAVHTFQPAARTSGSAPFFKITTPADTTLAASTEAIGISITAATRQWSSGSLIALQREVVFDAPTYAFTGANTITDAVNVDIANPVQGANATLTNIYALRAGKTKLSDLKVTTTCTPTANDGCALGSTALSFADLFLATGAVINVNAGNTTLTADGAGKVTVGGSQANGVNLTLAAGGTSLTPLTFTSGTNKTTPVAGDVEFDGVQYYATIDTTSKRGALQCDQYFHLTATGTAITTIANFFGSTSNISLVASAYYEIEIYCVFLKDASASVVTWTFTNSSAPTGQNIESVFSPATGIVTGTPTATGLYGFIYNDATAAKTIATASLSASVNHSCYFRFMLKNGSGTSLKIQATVTTGNITPGIGSWWRCRRISPNNIGGFAA